MRRETKQPNEKWLEGTSPVGEGNGEYSSIVIPQTAKWSISIRTHICVCDESEVEIIIFIWMRKKGLRREEEKSQQ